MPQPTFHVVLVEPEIPNNTGNIGRTCVAVGCRLHLVHPLGFSLDEKAVRRAGLDYWPRLDLAEHADWPACRAALDPARTWFFSTRGGRPVWDADLRAGDYLVFGRETVGLPRDVLEDHPGRVLRLPMAAGERSLNVASAVCAVVYEGLRQCIARGEVGVTESGTLTTPPGADPPTDTVR